MGRKAVTINPKRGERLRQLLQEYKVSQKEIATVLNYSPEQISYITNGKRNLTEQAAKEAIKYFNSINEDAAKHRASIMKKEMEEGKIRNSAWMFSVPEPEIIRFEWLMDYDDFKTIKEYEQHRIRISADNGKRSWDNLLNIQSSRKDTADRAFDLFLCMYGKRGTELEYEDETGALWSYAVEEYHDQDSNISVLYDDFRQGREIEEIFYPIIDLKNGGGEIPCLAEDYIAAVNKVSDYARLVINDLINTSKEKAKERENAKIAEEENEELEEWEEAEEDNNG
jgi:transcriptional regulator with XRE-family HTH domain